MSDKNGMEKVAKLAQFIKTQEQIEKQASMKKRAAVIALLKVYKSEMEKQAGIGKFLSGVGDVAGKTWKGTKGIKSDVTDLVAQLLADIKLSPAKLRGLPGPAEGISPLTQLGLPGRTAAHAAGTAAAAAPFAVPLAGAGAGLYGLNEALREPTMLEKLERLLSQIGVDVDLD